MREARLPVGDLEWRGGIKWQKGVLGGKQGRVGREQ
jgi:hypothetical protein